MVERSLQQFPLTISMYRFCLFLVVRGDMRRGFDPTQPLRVAMVPSLWNLVTKAGTDVQLHALQDWARILRRSASQRQAFQSHSCVGLSCLLLFYFALSVFPPQLGGAAATVSVCGTCDTCVCILGLDSLPLHCMVPLAWVLHVCRVASSGCGGGGWSSLPWHLLPSASR